MNLETYHLCVHSQLNSIRASNTLGLAVTGKATSVELFLFAGCLLVVYHLIMIQVVYSN